MESHKDIVRAIADLLQRNRVSGERLERTLRDVRAVMGCPLLPRTEDEGNSFIVADGWLDRPFHCRPT